MLHNRHIFSEQSRLLGLVIAWPIGCHMFCWFVQTMHCTHTFITLNPSLQVSLKLQCLLGKQPHSFTVDCCSRSGDTFGNWV